MRLSVIFLFGGLVIMGCAKKDSPEYVSCFPLTPSTSRITEESYYVGPDTLLLQKNMYIYDASDRLIYEIVSQGFSTDTVARYTYFQDKIVMNQSEYILNNQGLAVSFGGLKTWKYTATGYLAEETAIYAGESQTMLYYYTCNNPEQVNTTHYMSFGTRTDTTFYQYYSDKVNTIGNENHGRGFLGRQSNTLVKSQIAQGQVQYAYTYEFDDMNRVLWEIKTGHSGNLVYLKKYTYN